MFLIRPCRATSAPVPAAGFLLMIETILTGRRFRRLPVFICTCVLACLGLTSDVQGQGNQCDINSPPPPCSDCDNNSVRDVCEPELLDGLLGRYYTSSDQSRFAELIEVRTDFQVDFEWGDGSPGFGVPADNFAVIWTGTIESPISGLQEIATNTDDGVRLWVDGQLVIENWTNHSTQQDIAVVDFVAGERVPIRLEYFESGGGATCQLTWRLLGEMTFSSIPQEALRPDTDIDGDGYPDQCYADCNGNGILDGFEIADGTSQDCDGDSIPDECVILFGDCNEDGIPDICALESGAGDCNENGILDECDIASGMAQDIDGSGIPDECEDCNGNGVLDSSDISFGTSDDCDGNGVPDECGFGEALDPMLYGATNNVIDSNLNVVGAVELVWMKSFVAEEGGEWISAIEVVWGNTFPGQFAKVVVWTDPDGDGTPFDARVQTEVITESINVLSGEYTTVQIPPTYVGPAGTSFLVGVYYDNRFGGAPIALDYDDVSGDCWWAATVEYVMDIDDLNGTAFVAQSTSFEFMIRAIGSDGRYTGDCDDDGSIDGCDIAIGDSDDVNGNGVPDECEDFCQGDLDGNGRVDGADLGLFFAQWSSCGDKTCSADLNGDGEVDGIDLGIILSSWGLCGG